MSFCLFRVQFISSSKIERSERHNLTTERQCVGKRLLDQSENCLIGRDESDSSIRIPERRKERKGKNVYIHCDVLTIQ